MRPSQGSVSKGWFSSLLSLAGDTRGRKDQEAALREPLSSRMLEAGTFSLRAFPVLTTLCLNPPPGLPSEVHTIRWSQPGLGDDSSDWVTGLRAKSLQGDHC